MDDTQGLLSVIVPVYNAETTLRQCVDSILVQEYKDFELLLIDDGSQDGSPAICDEYAKQDVRVTVYHKENGGVSSARNVGLDKAKGEWITFIDSDDEVSSDYLSDIEERYEDVIFKSYKKILENNFIEDLCFSNEQRTTLPSFIHSHLTSSLLRAPWAKFYKKSVIGYLRFLTNMKIGEDAWFVFNYLARCKTFALSNQGTYFVSVDERPDDVKYAITVDYAVQSLNYLKDAYNQLVQVHGIQKAKFLEYIGYFKRISKSDWISDKKKWYSNQQIKYLYDYVWSDLSLFQKVRFKLAKIIKK
jgi:glycosyltransferase involved in cell wall biosynthesis